MAFETLAALYPFPMAGFVLYAQIEIVVKSFRFFEKCASRTLAPPLRPQGARTGQKLGEKIPCAVSRDRPKRPAPVRVMAKKLIKLTTIKVTTISM